MTQETRVAVDLRSHFIQLISMATNDGDSAMVRIASHHRSRDHSNPPNSGAFLVQIDELEPLARSFALLTTDELEPLSRTLILQLTAPHLHYFH